MLQLLPCSPLLLQELVLCCQLGSQLSSLSLPLGSLLLHPILGCCSHLCLLGCCCCRLLLCLALLCLLLSLENLQLLAQVPVLQL